MINYICDSFRHFHLEEIDIDIIEDIYREI